mmetsp:Transcript_30706/g.34999  ORF Transcript_30706/g.34999 Transcript_30706/m.34999 type:complete len:731 (+) Transcript_30706:98-2290(+)
MSVRNHIAVFEAHNENVRNNKSSASSSSSHEDELGENESFDDLFEFQEQQQKPKDLQSKIPNPKILKFDTDSTKASSITSSITSADSATGRASQSRRNRLLREKTKAVVPQTRNMVSIEEKSSLSERRKARQQRIIQKRRSDRNHKSPQVEHESRHESWHEPSDNPPSRLNKNTRQQPTPQVTLSPTLTSNRRFVHTVSAESESQDEGPPTPTNSYHASPGRRAKVQRMHWNRQGDFSSPGFDDDDNTQFNSLLGGGVDGTDDEATLTSVRQIMRGEPAPPNLLQQSVLHTGNHLSKTDAMYHHQHAEVVRTTSSSSFEGDPRHTMKIHPSTSLPPRVEDDDTLDYADLLLNEDGDSLKNYGNSRSRRRQGEEAFNNGGHPSLISKDDVEHYRQSLDTPVVKTAAGVVAAATIGTIILGPVGLLVGAATVGIGVGIMQIPEEQRNNMKDKATETLHKAHESVLNASEALSSTCANACMEHKDQFPQDVKRCFTQDSVQPTEDQHSITMQPVGDGERVMTSNISNGGNNLQSFIASSEGPSSPLVLGGRNRRVACLRNARITTISQIHSLPPKQQPRAWLDVMASATTTDDEKSEAMEEILILAKDKQHSRILLVEGILDSLMYILNRHFERRRRGVIVDDQQQRSLVKLAANCCIILGKAHCAAIHTEGDLLLMSMYERGLVPEERQLAQMLYEVPHHILSKEPDVFVLQHASMSLAEDLGADIKYLATT